jgi:DNA-binding MarR family transcriptional regulator
MSRPKQLQQVDLPVYQANLNWFLMFSAEIQNNLVARLTPNVFAIWVVLRAHAELATGKVFLSTSDLQRLTGLSRKTVLKAIDRLADEKHIQICTEGKQKRRFFVVDLVKFQQNGHTEPESQALAVRYVPKTASRDREAITQFIQSGNLNSLGTGTPNVWVLDAQQGGLTVNTDGGPVFVFQMGDSNVIAAAAASVENPEVRELLLRLGTARTPPTT